MKDGRDGKYTGSAYTYLESKCEMQALEVTAFRVTEYI